jgi:hypothetical protein
MPDTQKGTGRGGGWWATETRVETTQHAHAPRANDSTRAAVLLRAHSINIPNVWLCAEGGLKTQRDRDSTTHTDTHINTHTYTHILHHAHHPTSPYITLPSMKHIRHTTI